MLWGYPGDRFNDLGDSRHKVVSGMVTKILVVSVVSTNEDYTMVAELKITAAEDFGFEYKFASIADLRVETEEDPKTGKQKVSKVFVEDEPLDASTRFWTSLFARYGFNSSMFKYFSHDEAFKRISEVESNDRMRLCIERGSSNRLLAVSNTAKPVVSFTELHDLLGRYGGRNVTYVDGIVESTHSPRNGGGDMMIGPDVFRNEYVMGCPIDGYGMPNVWLSLLRLLCTNGVIAATKAFKTGVALGKSGDDVGPALVRVLDGFNSEEGYSAIRMRIESAQKSWASVYEAQALQGLLYTLHAKRMIDDVGAVAAPKGTRIAELYKRGRDHIVIGDDDDAVMSAPIFAAFDALVGSPTKTYGIANLNGLAQKRQRTLPVACSVYELINFATEVATHYSQPSGARHLNAHIGGLLTSEYDMEGTREKFSNFADFHVDQKLVSGVTGSKT